MIRDLSRQFDGLEIPTNQNFDVFCFVKEAISESEIQMQKQPLSLPFNLNGSSQQSLEETPLFSA